MKRVILFLVLFGLLKAWPDTTVNGEVSGTWTKTESPYVVIGDIWVSAGKGLVIEEGVLVRFDQGKVFSVWGSLSCGGTETEPVVFAGSSEVNGYWKGINVLGGWASFRWCHILYGESNLTLDEGVAVIEDSFVGSSSYCGVSLNAGIATITDTTFAGNAWPILQDINSRPIFTGTITLLDKDYIYLSGTTLSQDNTFGRDDGEPIRYYVPNETTITIPETYTLTVLPNTSVLFGYSYWDHCR
ncbi:MAG: hypothetical protein V2A53_00780, partial [bacterium]